MVMAGGFGERMGTDVPKQFICLGGDPVILHTLRVFQEHMDIDEIVVVCVSGWEDFVYRLALENGLTKLIHIVAGGQSNHESIQIGVKSLCRLYDAEDIILVHDSVRPFVSEQIISDNIRICRENGNAITAILDNEALMYSTDGISSDECFPRELMYRAQTPHTFRLKDLEEAYKEAEQKGICAQSLYTLMAALERYPLYIAKGSRINMKLTVPEDIKIFESLLLLKKNRTINSTNVKRNEIKRNFIG